MSIPARRIASRSNWVGLEESRLLIMLPSRLDKKINNIEQKKQQGKYEIAYLVTVNDPESLRMPKKST